jgi:hypothetical protein
MVEVTGERRGRRPAARPPHTNLLHYPVARDGRGALNLLCVPLASRGEALVVFSSRDTARDASPSAVFPGDCEARVCSGGELVSLLFGPYKNVQWVLFDPPPGAVPEGSVDETNLVDRGRFVDYLLGRSTLPSRS